MFSFHRLDFVTSPGTRAMSRVRTQPSKREQIYLYGTNNVCKIQKYPIVFFDVCRRTKHMLQAGGSQKLYSCVCKATQHGIFM
jgi:hypothetical protein